MGNPTGAVWDKQTPFIAHSNFGKNVWYSNDNDFKKIVSMPGKSFTKNDAYAMRWTGNLMVPQAGKWCIKTRSDDGSQVWVNNKKIVDNDGNHGPRDLEEGLQQARPHVLRERWRCHDAGVGQGQGD